MASVYEGEGEGTDPNPLPLRRPIEGVFQRPKVYTIREIYDSENAYENFEQQLERCLAQEYQIIVVEPFKLGDETARWIAVGNWLHKTAVISGFGSLIASFVWPKAHFLTGSLTLLTTLCTGLYSLSWQFDPCCKYQVESDPKQLDQLALQSLNSTSPVVLVRRDDTRRKVLHTAVTLACLAQIGLKFYYPSMYRMFNPVFSSSSRAISSGRSLGQQIIVTNYSRHSPPTLPTSTGFMSVLAEGVGILDS